MISTINKLQEKYFSFLNKLHHHDVVCMSGAVPYLVKQFPELSDLEAIQLVIQWIDSNDC